MRIGLALLAFFRVLFDRETAEAVRPMLRGPAPKEGASRESPTKPLPAEAPPAPPIRNDAITLLATLQREARWVDLVQESLDSYSDAQVGAAARSVIRDCGSVLDRLFGLQPIIADAEGTRVEIPTEADLGRYRVIGTPSGAPPFAGTLTHHGWKATRCRLPTWQGNPDSALVVAPAEVDVAKE